MDQRRGVVWGWLLPLLGIGLVFAPCVTFDFVSWDDPSHVLANPLVTAPSSQPWSAHLLTPVLGYPSPLTVLTYRLEYALVGDAPWLYHAVNVLLHLAVCTLVYSLARGIGLARSGACLALIVFGLHPAVAETVSWVSGRKDLLAALFGLLATRLVLGRAPSYQASLASIASFFAALACKPVAAMYALAIPVLRIQLHGVRWQAALRGALPYLAGVSVLAPIAVAGQRAVHAVQPPETWLLALRYIWYALGVHLDIVTLVQEPTVKYLPPVVPMPFTWRVDLAPLWCLALGALAYAATRDERRQSARLGLLFAALAYAPNSNLIPLTRFAADTYVYLPLVGLAWFSGALFEELLTRATSSRVMAIGLPAAAAVTLALLAVPSSARFHDSFSLWDHAYERFPHDPRLCRNRANSLLTLRGREAGLTAIDGCIERFGPDLFAKNRVIVLMQLGRHEEARRELARMAAAHPEDPGVIGALRAWDGTNPPPDDAIP